MELFTSIKILSQRDAWWEIIHNSGKYNVVSIWSGAGGKHNAEQPEFGNREKSLCQQRFHDVTFLKPGDNRILCDRNHLTEILKFARTHYNDNLIVHCFEGISRSSAITWCILLDYYKSPAKAFEQLIKIKSADLIQPNLHILKLGVDTISKDKTDEMYDNQIFLRFYPNFLRFYPNFLRFYPNGRFSK